MKLFPLCLGYSEGKNSRAAAVADPKHQLSKNLSEKPASTNDTKQSGSGKTNLHLQSRRPAWIHQSSRHLGCDYQDNAELLHDHDVGHHCICSADGSKEVSDLSGDSQQQRLPRKDSFANNHILVNTARQAHHLPVLHRNTRLDFLAQRHAAHMAQCESVQHSCRSVVALQEKLSHGANGNHPLRVAENVFRGTSVRQMHRDTMERGTNARANLLSPCFDEFGMGTAMDRHGRLYMVQLFCSRATECNGHARRKLSSERGNRCLKAKSIGRGEFEPSLVWI